MQLLMVNHIIKKPVGMAFDVFIKVDNFMFSTDFDVLEYEVDFEIPIIL